MEKKHVHLILISMGLIATGIGCNNPPAPPPNGPCGYEVCYTSLTPEQFVTQLVQLANDGKIDPAYAKTTLAKEVTEQPNTFIIWDSKFQHYVAVDGYQTDETYNDGTVTGDTSFTGPLGYTTQTSPLVVVNPIGNGPDGIPQYEGSNGTIYANEAATKDVDLQRAQMQSETTIRTAAALSAGFQMDFGAAMKITQLGERIKAMGAQNLTTEDRAAVMSTLMGVSGITQQELNQTIIAGIQGDGQAVNTLLTKVSQNLGMPSSTILRDRLLPALGVNLDN